MNRRRLCSIALVATTVTLVAACGDEATSQRRAANPVPDSHPSVDIAARSRSAGEFAAQARNRDLAFACGQGGLAPQWEVCMLRADGVVAVVGFGDTAGIDARLTGLTRDGVVVPLEPRVVYGVLEPEGRVHLVIESGGREIGELEAEL